MSTHGPNHMDPMLYQCDQNPIFKNNWQKSSIVAFFIQIHHSHNALRQKIAVFPSRAQNQWRWGGNYKKELPKLIELGTYKVECESGRKNSLWANDFGGLSQAVCINVGEGGKGEDQGLFDSQRALYS